MSVFNKNFCFIKNTLQKPDIFFSKNHLSELKNKACYSFDYTKYGFMETWEAAFEKINNIAEQNKLFNELLTSQHNVKPYLDIEWYKEDFPSYDPDKVKIYLKDKITLIFKEYHDIELVHDNFKIASCHRQSNKGYKYSFHFIIHTINPMYVYSNTLSACYLANKLREEFTFDGIYSNDIIDKNVYKSKQNMRIIGQYKSGDYKNCFIKDNPSDDDLEYLISNIQRKHVIIPVEEQEDKFIDITEYKNIAFNDAILNHIIDKVKVLHPTAKLTSIDSKNFLQFNYSDRSEQCFCHADDKILHDKIGFFVYVNIDNIACAGCHSNNCLTEENKKILVPITNISNFLLENIPNNAQISEDNDFSYIELNRIKECMHEDNLGLSKLLCDMFLKPAQRVINTGSQKRSSRECYIWNGDYWEQDITDTLFNKSVYCLVKLLKNTRQLLTIKPAENVSFSNDFNKTIQLISSRIDTLNKGGKSIQDMLTFFNHSASINSHLFLEKKDKNFYYLPCKNGMVDLRTGEILQRTPHQYVTKILSTKYSPNADSSDFDNFIREILKEIDGTLNEDKYNFFRWVIGQALTRDPKKLFVILHGPESYNGKSTFVGVLKEVLEWLTDEVDSSVILESSARSKGSHTTELMALKDLCMAFITETKADSVIDDAQVKRLTGRDNISGRQIYKEQTTFKSRCVPIVCTNKVIKLDLKDRALYERTVIFTLKLSFVNDPKKPYERKRDGELEDRLLENKEGILKWLVDCGKYYCSDMSLIYPSFVKEEKDFYMKQIDPYIDFLDRYFYTNVGPENTFSMKDLIELFTGYTIENCIKKIPKKNVIENFTKILKVENQECIGIKLIDESNFYG